MSPLLVIVSLSEEILSRRSTSQSQRKHAGEHSMIDQSQLNPQSCGTLHITRPRNHGPIILQISSYSSSIPQSATSIPRIQPRSQEVKRNIKIPRAQDPAQLQQRGQN